MINLGIQVYVSMLFCLCSAAFSCYMISKKCIDLADQNEQLKESIKKLEEYLKLLENRNKVSNLVFSNDIKPTIQDKLAVEYIKRELKDDKNN